jgi:acetyltransferase
MSGSTESILQERSVRLRDGSEVVVRPIREDDAEKLQKTIRSMSDESRYSRFFTPLRELPKSLLERATHPDAATELQLIAVAGEGSEAEIVGGARIVATTTRGTCEFAVAIADHWHGRGLARLLLESLMVAARERGFVAIEGYVLMSNGAMLGLAERLGFERFDSSEGPTICIVRRELGAS